MKKSVALGLLLLLLVACQKEPATSLPGYLEVENTYVAAPIAGRMLKLSVEKGSQVAQGSPLFILESESEKASVDEAQAHVQRSSAQLADLAKGKRQDEIAVIRAQLAAAQAALGLAQSNLHRQSELARVGFISSASLDALRTQVAAQQAQVNEIQAQMKVASLAAREDARAAANADVVAAQAQLQQSRWRLDQKMVNSPVQAGVEDTLYRLGEWVPAGMPVVSLRTQDALKVRFFVPQDQVARYPLGRKLQIHTDSGENFQARVSYVAKSAEFTPPVIYSKENRAKLVFMLEAKPDAGLVLPAGLPVDVSLLP